MRVVVLTGEQPNQIALCCKIAEKVDVCAIVLSENVPRERAALGKRAKLIANAVAGRTIGRPLVKAWFAMQNRYAAAFPNLPPSDLVRVRNVNDPGTLAAIARHSPDLVIVSGTNLVGRRIIEAANLRKGIVNLHTGISPYVKGGPNCTYWCLAKGWFHLIGNTVMWLDTGIDTGNIIATERTPLVGDESLEDLQWKVMEHGHDLYLRSLARIANGDTVSAVEQSSIAPGTSFRSTQWTAAEMYRALSNHRRRYKPGFSSGVVSDPRVRSIRLVTLNGQ